MSEILAFKLGNQIFSSDPSASVSASTSSPLDSARGPGPKLFVSNERLSPLISNYQVSSPSGIDWYRSSELPFEDVVADYRLSNDQVNKLKEIWVQARTAEGKDVGVYLRHLIPELLERGGDGLNALHELATGDMLLKVSEMRRQDHVAARIASAADRNLRRQGHTSFCTAAIQSLDELSAVAWIKVSRDLFLHGEHKWPNGRVMQLGYGESLADRIVNVEKRLLTWIPKQTGMDLNDESQPYQLKGGYVCAQPDPLSTLILAEMKEQNSPGANLGGGQQEQEWSLSAAELGKYEVYVARRDARIPLNEQGMAIRPGRRSVSSVTPLEYVSIDLDRQWSNLKIDRPKTAADTVAIFSDLSKQRELLDENKSLLGTQINIGWGDHKCVPGKKSEHGYHQMQVVNKITNESGQTFYILINPIGDYIKSDGPGRASRYEYGTTLGDVYGSGMKWTQLSHGLVQVSAEDFERHLEHVTVALRNERSSYVEGKKGLVLTSNGLMEFASRVNVGKGIPVPGTPPPAPAEDVYVMYEVQRAEPSPNVGSPVSSLGELSNKIALAENSIKARSMYLRDNPEAEKSKDPARYKRLEDELRNFDNKIAAEEERRRRRRRQQDEQSESVST